MPAAARARPAGLSRALAVLLAVFAAFVLMSAGAHASGSAGPESRSGALSGEAEGSVDSGSTDTGPRLQPAPARRATEPAPRRASTPAARPDRTGPVVVPARTAPARGPAPDTVRCAVLRC
ncbi:hypothetical protein ACFYVL_30085 [Streptomyces sp. NPDC004111]|uniref:hypothetical protein n=1 Tax=Streptomyces sp. NPDC004111 TaxID=3364690 RepID=UPI0036785B38